MPFASAARDDRLGERVLAGALDAGGEAQDLVLRKAFGRHDRGHGRPALGQRAGLVDDERVDLLHALQRLGVLDQHAGLRAAADADHDRHRRRQPERTGAGDDEHGHGRDQAVGEARLRPPDAPGGEGEQRHQDDGGDEPARDLVGEPLDRRAAPLRLGDELDDAATSSVSRPTFSARITRLPVWFIVPPIARAPGSFVTGIDSPVTIDSSTAPLPSVTTPSTGTRSPGRTRKQVADRDLVERDLLLAAVGAHAARGLRREVEQRADGAAGRFAGAQLQHLAEQHQHGDDGRRLEIDRARRRPCRGTPPERARARASRRRCRARPRRCPWRSA